MTPTSQHHPAHRRSRLLRFLVGAALTVALTACSVPLNPSATSAPPGTKTTQASATAPASADPSQAAPSSVGEPVASRTAALDGYSLAFDVYPLKRSGDLVTLNARLRVIEAPPDNNKLAPAGLLGTEEALSVRDQTPGGLVLIDTENQLRYRPALDDEDRVMCSPTIPSRWQTGDEIYVSCVYGAPKSSTVTVDAVTFGSIPDVPVE